MKLTDTQRELVARPEHLELAKAIARRCATRYGQPADELQASAFFGLVRAARRYLPDRGAFADFAYRHIHGAIIDDMRTWLSHGFRGAHRIPREIQPSSLDTDTAEAIAARELPVGWELESEDAVRAMCKRVPSKMGAALAGLLLRADLGRMSAVGVALGVCEGHAARLVNEALKMLADSGSREREKAQTAHTCRWRRAGAVNSRSREA